MTEKNDRWFSFPDFKSGGVYFWNADTNEKCEKNKDANYKYFYILFYYLKLNFNLKLDCNSIFTQARH